MVAEPTRPVERNSAAVMAAFEAAPPELIAQVLHGSLQLKPRPARAHTGVATLLTVVPGAPFRLGRGGPGGWTLLAEPEVRFGARPDILVPDIAGWKRARMPDAVGGAVTPAFYDLVPNWICEVLSPGTEVIDRDVKMPIYAREGVAHAWIVDPVRRALEAYARDGAAWRRLAEYEGDVRVKAAPFDAVEMDLAEVWAG